MATPLQAASYNWAVASGDWFDGFELGRTLPTGSDNAYIVNGGTAAVTPSGAVCQSLYLGDPSSTQSGTVQMSGGDLSASYEIPRLLRHGHPYADGRNSTTPSSTLAKT